MNEDFSFDKNSVLLYMQERFGVSPETLAKYSFYATEKGKIFVGPTSPVVQSDKIVSIGLLCFRIDNSIKPTTNLLQIVGKYVIKNKIELDQKNAQDYILGRDLILDKNFLLDASDGYVLLTYKGHSLGCGLLKENVIKNQLPKAKRLEVKYW